MYWDKVLEEVLNKDSAQQSFAFTNLADFNSKKKNQDDESKKLANKAQRGKTLKIYRLGEKFGTVYFTRREAECMVWLLKGKTISRVAMELGLSPRTVEFYLKNMKVKLGCRTKFELVEKVLDSEFMAGVDF